MQLPLFPNSSIKRIEFCASLLEFHPQFLSNKEAQQFFVLLEQELDWQQDEVFLYGKKHPIPRLNAWYGETDYTYSRNHMPARPFGTTLDTLRQKIEDYCGISYNSVLANFYRNGQDTMGWHADVNDGSDPNIAIASLSLGAERRFLFRENRSNNSKEPPKKLELLLNSGSLLLMHPPTQERTQHSVPRSKKISHPRINLTFRSMLLP